MPLHDFSATRSYCKPCATARSKKWWYEQPQAVRTMHSRKRWLCYTYDMTLEQFADLVKKQNGVCAICRKVPIKQFHVDHNKEFKFNRGLLCPECNKGLGLFYEDIEFLQAAIDYLHEWEI
jgi:hypothetical protein